MPEVVTRAEAERLGLNRYFTGKPCKYGHVSERLMNSYCEACSKAMHAARYLARTDEYKSRANARYAENGDECRARMREYYAENNETIRAATAEYQRNNAEKSREWRRNWSIKNPGAARKSKANRRAKVASCGGSLRGLDINELLKLQRFKCAGCKVSVREKYHLDHIMPLALGGENLPRNIQALCPQCNWRKSDKHPIDWAQENGRLL